MSWSPDPLPPDWPARRRRVLTRDQGICHLCHQPGATEVDHITPRSQGGTHNYSNLAAICTPCHRTKTAREANEARRRRYGRQRRPEPHPGLLRAE